MQREDILTFLKQNMTQLQQQYHIQKIGLFGSFARNEATEESDIDLVIVSAKKSFRNRYGLKHFLEEKFQKAVDIGYLDSLHPFVQKQIKDEIIYV